MLNNRKVIGIITFQRANNYGAVFQAYALTKYLENCGHEVFILDYQQEKTGIFGYMRHPLCFIRKVAHKKALSMNFLRSHQQKRKEKNQERTIDFIFSEFRKQHLKLSDVTYDYRKLVQSCPKADIFICGSDQVWSTDFVFSSTAYLLGFVPPGIKKVAYAPSFGKDRIEPHLHRTLERELRTFSAISVREKSGARIIKEITGLEVDQVLDPTLLLDDYSEIIDYSLVPDKPYILVYRLGQEYKLACWMLESIKKISKQLNIPVISVSPNCSWNFEINENNMYPTPGQLLGLIEKSHYFITNSFHGAVFATIFRRRFLVFARDVFEDRQNVRIMELLSSLKMESLYCTPFLDFSSIVRKLDMEFTFDNAHTELNRQRIISKRYLHEALC